VNHPTIKFRPTLVNQIRHGRKTQARRPVRYSKHIDGRTGRPRRTMRPCPLKENDVVQLVEVDEQPCAWDDLSAAERVRYAKLGFGPGATIYRQQESPCESDFIRIEGTPALQALVDASDEDIAAEGFGDREEFFDYYEATYGQYVETVWVIGFQWTSDVTRFLAEQAGHVHPEQYVYSLGGALRGERDAVDPQTLSDYARQNRDKDRVRKLERRARRLDDKRSIDERLAEYRRMGLSTRDTERLIQRKLKELEDKARRAA
jgi:hypothetical protein